MQTDESLIPWYKQFWPWFIVGILVLAVIIGLGLLFISLFNQDSMVRDNYYKEGRAINMHLGRDQMARDLDLSAEFFIDDLTGEVSLDLAGELQAWPATLQLDLISPTLAARDRTLLLKKVDESHYAGQIEQGISGRHYVDLSDPDKPGELGWRLTDELTIDMGQHYRLSANE